MTLQSILNVTGSQCRAAKTERLSCRDLNERKSLSGHFRETSVDYSNPVGLKGMYQLFCLFLIDEWLYLFWSLCCYGTWSLLYVWYKIYDSKIYNFLHYLFLNNNLWIFFFFMFIFFPVTVYYYTVNIFSLSLDFSFNSLSLFRHEKEGFRVGPWAYNLHVICMPRKGLLCLPDCTSVTTSRQNNLDGFHEFIRNSQTTRESVSLCILLHTKLDAADWIYAAYIGSRPEHWENKEKRKIQLSNLLICAIYKSYE